MTKTARPRCRAAERKSGQDKYGDRLGNTGTDYNGPKLRRKSLLQQMLRFRLIAGLRRPEPGETPEACRFPWDPRGARQGDGVLKRPCEYHSRHKCLSANWLCLILGPLGTDYAFPCFRGVSFGSFGFRPGFCGRSGRASMVSRRGMNSVCRGAPRCACCGE